MKGPSLDPLVLGLPVPLAILDRHGRVVGANRRMERLAGRPVGELIGALFVAELFEAPPDVEARFRESLASGMVDLRFHGSVAAYGDVGAAAHPVHLRSFTHEDGVYVLAWLDDDAPDRAGAPRSEELNEVFRQISKARHQLNNLLMGLLGQAELLCDMRDVSDEVRTRAEAVMRQAGKLRDAVSAMGAIYKR